MLRKGRFTVGDRLFASRIGLDRICASKQPALSNQHEAHELDKTLFWAPKKKERKNIINHCNKSRIILFTEGQGRERGKGL